MIVCLIGWIDCLCDIFSLIRQILWWSWWRYEHYLRIDLYYGRYYCKRARALCIEMTYRCEVIKLVYVWSGFIGRLTGVTMADGCCHYSRPLNTILTVGYSIYADGGFIKMSLTWVRLDGISAANHGIHHMCLQLRILNDMAYRPASSSWHYMYVSTWTTYYRVFTRWSERRANIELAQAGLLELRPWLKCI